MPYGVVWLHDAPESGKRKLVSAPEAIEASNVNEAKQEGSTILGELSPEHRAVIKPLAVVELNDQMLYGIKGCERIFLPMNDDDDGELEFVDVSQTDYWTSQGWWHK